MSSNRTKYSSTPTFGINKRKSLFNRAINDEYSQDNALELDTQQHNNYQPLNQDNVTPAPFQSQFQYPPQNTPTP